MYDALSSVDKDIDFNTVKDNLENHLTVAERKVLEQIKQDVVQHTDMILEHGYTGLVNEANTESIVTAVIVSIISRRCLVLNSNMGWSCLV